MNDELHARFEEMVRRLVAPLRIQDAPFHRLLRACRVVRLGRSETLLSEGDVATDVYFVGSGLLRTVHIDRDAGVERTGQFFDAGQVFSDAAAVLTARAATESIAAIEDSAVLAIPFAALKAAFDDDHALERFGRLAVEEALMGAHRRATRLLNQSVEERYRTFVSTRPEVAGRVPQYLIASYLGVTPEALSRVRGRIARRNNPGRAGLD